MDEETKYWVAFSLFPGIGPVRFGALLTYFGSAKSAFFADEKILQETHLPAKLVKEFLEFRNSRILEDYLKELKRQSIFVLTLNHPHYPPRLKQIPAPPFVLYVKGKKGETPLDLDRTIGVVGTRKITSYGEEVTRRLTQELVGNGFTIISGMAYGVDAVAHATALDAGGQTIAVLGCGVDVIAPPCNSNLYHRIETSGMGAIISEMPLGHQPNKGLFPARNRIISGLSLGVIVTEGADDSGALITARYAAEQNREVFAVPGPITSPYSHGPAKLLKDGAKLVENVNDILEELHLSPSHSKKTLQTLKGQTPQEEAVIKLLGDRRLYIDEMLQKLHLETPQLSAILTILELRGIVKDYGGKVYGLA